MRSACTRAGVDPASLRLNWQSAGDRAAREEVRRLRPRLGDRMAAKLARWEIRPSGQTLLPPNIVSQAVPPKDALVGPLVRRERLKAEMVAESLDRERESRRSYWLQVAEKAAADERAMAEAEAGRTAALLGRSRRLERDREASIRSARTMRRIAPRTGAASRGSSLQGRAAR